MNRRLPPLRVGFGRFELRLARRMRSYEKKHRRTPKMREVVLWDVKNDPLFECRGDKLISHNGFTDRRAFGNLLRLGLALHARNGHCWLTDKGKKYLHRAKR